METMKYHPWESLLFLALVVLATATVAGDDADSNGKALIEWLRSKEGFFNSRLEIRRAEPNDPSSRLGMFAKDKIQAKELLLEIPPDCLITAGAPAEYQDGMDCDTVRNLVTEMKLGDDSEFAPYVNYLLSGSPSLPSVWSEAGKDLFLEILGTSTYDQVLPPRNPVGWIERDWYDKCDGSDNPFEENAAMMVVQRGWDDVLVPVFDMMNHRNGHWLNTEENSVRTGNTVEVRASRNIEAGEELYTTYNFCVDCGNVAEVYGTPEIFGDYGFVEEYPQRWIFDDHQVAFELDEKYNKDSTGSGELEVSWIGNEPSEEAVSFLQEQLQRLQDLAEAELLSPDERVPKNEWGIIWQYHQALADAMTHAIAAALGEDGEKYLNGEVISLDRYDELEEEDDLNCSACTCDQDLEFPGYDVIKEIDTSYQEIVFIKDPKNTNVCFELDGNTSRPLQ